MYEIHGYGRGNYFLTGSKGASQIYEAIRELVEEDGLMLKTRRKHVTLQFSIGSAQEEWNKCLISKIINVTNEINKKSRRGSANYLIIGTPVIDFVKGLTIPIHKND